MGIFDALFGTGGNLLGQYLNVGYQKELQENQYKLNKKAYQYSLRMGPSLTRSGLERSGYNPILATNASMGSGGFSVSPANAPNTSDLGTDAVNAYQNSQRINNENKSTEATVQNLASQSNQANAQAELNKEQAITEQAKRTQMEFQNAMYDVEKHLKEKELSWADRKFYSEIYDNMQRAENYGAMASIARYNAETERRNSQTNAMNAETNIFNARTSRADSISQHNARQVDLNLRNANYELSKLKAPFEMSRDTAIGIGGLFGLKTLGNSRYHYPHSPQNSKVIRSLHTFGKTKSH